MRYHINNEEKVGRCSAKPGQCPFGDESEHFDSALSAKAEVEHRKARKAAIEGSVSAKRKRGVADAKESVMQKVPAQEEVSNPTYHLPPAIIDDDPMYGGWEGANSHYGRRERAPKLREEIKKAIAGGALSKGFKARVSSNFYSINLRVESITEADGAPIDGTPYSSIDRIMHDTDKYSSALSRLIIFDRRDGVSGWHFADVLEKHPENQTIRDLDFAASIASSFTYNKSNAMIDYFNSGPRVEVYVPTDIEYSEKEIKSATRKLDRLYEKIEKGTATDKDKTRFRSLIETAKYHRDRKRFFERRNEIAEEDLKTDKHLYERVITDTDTDNWNQAAWKEMVSKKDHSDSEFHDIIQRRYPKAVGIAGI